jgi:hypothetical protein
MRLAKCWQTIEKVANPEGVGGLRDICLNREQPTPSVIAPTGDVCVIYGQDSRWCGGVLEGLNARVCVGLIGESVFYLAQRGRKFLCRGARSCGLGVVRVFARSLMGMQVC